MLNKYRWVITGLLLNVSIVQGGDDPYAVLLTYDYGQKTTPLFEIEAQIRAATPAQYAPIEDKLLVVLQAPGAKDAGKKFVCEMLLRCGSVKCLPTLSALLTNEKQSSMARFALQGLPYPEVAVLLREALAKTKGPVKMGIISTIGARGDQQAVSSLAALTGNTDTKVAGAALMALGRIGGAEATRVLGQAQVAAPLQACRDEAWLMCAASVCTTQPDEAVKICQQLFVETKPLPLRVAALRMMARANPSSAIPVVLSAMKDKDTALSGSAVQLLGEIPGADATRAIAASLSTVPASQQVMLLNRLADRGDRSAVGVAVEAFKHNDPVVIASALLAIGRLGGADQVALLLAATDRKDEVAAIARKALTLLNTQGSDEALLSALDKAASGQAQVLIGVLSERRTGAACSTMIRLISKSPDRLVRAEAIKAAGVLGQLGDLQEMVALLLTRDASEQALLAKAIVEVGLRQGDRDRRTEAVLAALPAASQEKKAELLRIAGNLGGPKVLAVVHDAMTSADTNVSDAAVRALVEWPDDSAADDILKVAREGKNRTHRILALRSYIRLAGLAAENREVPKAFQILQTARPLCIRPEDKCFLLGTLPELRSVPAMNMTLEYLNDPDVSNEAAAAAVRMAKDFGRKNRPAVAQAMTQVLAVCKDDALCKEARKMTTPIEKGAKK